MSSGDRLPWQYCIRRRVLGTIGIKYCIVLYCKRYITKINTFSQLCVLAYWSALPVDYLLSVVFLKVFKSFLVNQVSAQGWPSQDKGRAVDSSSGPRESMLWAPTCSSPQPLIQHPTPPPSSLHIIVITDSSKESEGPLRATRATRDPRAFRTHKRPARA